MSEEAVLKRTPLPDVADIIFLLLIVLITNMLPNFVLGDGSTGWHLGTGEWILNHAAIPSTDLFSNTFPDKPWVPYEWLSDVVGAVLNRVGGIKMVAVATACAISWLFSLIYLECRRSGCNAGIAMVLTIIAALCSSIHWLARPHIFTFFGVFLMARHLEKYRTGEESAKRLIISTAVIMAIWSNCHPAFLVGFALIIIYICAEAVERWFSGGAGATASNQRLKIFGAAFGTAVLATFVNPNGLKMYGYIFHYLRQSEVLANTNEYMPPNLHDLHAACMVLLFFIFIGFLAAAKRGIGLAPVLMVLAFAYLGLTSMRNEPLFAVVATPIAGALFAQFSFEKLFGREFIGATWFTNWMEKLRPGIKDFDEMEKLSDMHLLPIVVTVVLVIACVFGGKIGPLELVTSDWEANTKPIKTLACIKSLNLDWHHGLNLDNWGGYIFWKTHNRVFIDDRLDFYGSPFYLDYKKMIQMEPDWKKTMDKHGITWVLFPKKDALIGALKRTGDFQVVCEDEGSVVLVRKDVQNNTPDAKTTPQDNSKPEVQNDAKPNPSKELKSDTAK